MCEFYIESSHFSPLNLPDLMATSADLSQSAASADSSAPLLSSVFPSFFDGALNKFILIHIDWIQHHFVLPVQTGEDAAHAPRETSSDDEECAPAAPAPESAPTASAAASSALPGWGMSSNDETNEPDEGTWITAENLHGAQAHELVEVESAAVAIAGAVSAVAVITTDFAMQNVLLQMGLRLLSVNGMAVSTLRSSIKRCYGCFRIERSMEREFCQYCGGHTLVRVAITVDSSGRLKWKQSNRQVFWKRGTVYSIPKPKRGELPMLLREDQLQVGRMRQLQNNQRRADKQAARALFGAEAQGPPRGNGRGRAAAQPATKSLLESNAFGAEKMIANSAPIQVFPSSTMPHTCSC